MVGHLQERLDKRAVEQVQVCRSVQQSQVTIDMDVKMDGKMHERSDIRTERKKEEAKHSQHDPKEEGIKEENIQKKKLVIASDSFMPRWDGIARFLSDLIPNIKDIYDITVLAPEHQGEFKPIEGVKIIRFPLSFLKFGDFVLPTADLKLIKQTIKEADIVMINSIGPIGAFSIIYAHKFKKPSCAYIHSIDWELWAKATTYSHALQYLVHFFSKIYARWLYRKCTIIIVPSHEVSQLFNAEHILNAKVIVNLGIDNEKFKPAQNKEEAKEKIGFPPKSIVIGYTGRIAREKDLMTLLMAYKRLKKRHKQLKLLIVGEGLDSIKQQLLSVEGVTVTGFKSDVIPYLQAMDIYVLPSLTETSSLSTMEAMSSGLPVVVTKVGNLKRYIKERINGLLFPKTNVTVLSLKLDWLLQKESVRASIGRNARDTIVNHYSWNKTVEGIKKVLEGLE
jgi:glycosyltransferase involved in cell wall biosynthesis